MWGVAVKRHVWQRFCVKSGSKWQTDIGGKKWIRDCIPFPEWWDDLPPAVQKTRGPWPPRWAPEGREVSNKVVVIDRFHCTKKLLPEHDNTELHIFRDISTYKYIFMTNHEGCAWQLVLSSTCSWSHKWSNNKLIKGNTAIRSSHERDNEQDFSTCMKNIFSCG